MKPSRASSRAGARATLDVLIALAALCVGFVLLTGGRESSAGGVSRASSFLVSSAIVLAALLAARLALGVRGGAAREAALLAALFAIAYLGNYRTTASGDTVPASHLPFSVLRHATFYLDELVPAARGCVPYFVRLVGGHFVSVYPVAPALAALPFYILPALGGVAHSQTFVAALEKLAASTLVALSAAVVYATVRRRASRWMAVFVTLAYGLGSSSFSISSQGLWQHGPAQLLLAIALWALLHEERTPAMLVVAGLALGGAVACRPPLFLIALPLAISVLVTARRDFAWFVAGVAAPAAFLVWYNATYFHDPFHLQWALADKSFRTTPFATGLAGLLVSPGRGLLVYSPVFAFSLVGLVRAWRRGGDALLRASGVGVALLLVMLSRWDMWWGGFTYGPRLLADALPVLALALVPLETILVRRGAWRTIATALLVWSVGVHAVGAFGHDYYWNAYRDVDRYPERLWSWSDNQLVNPFTQVVNRALVVAERRATSRTDPGLVSGSFVTGSAATSFAAEETTDTSVEVANDGRAVWLAWPRRADGAVALAWRWIEAGSTPGAWAGTLPLYRDVAPGERYAFALVALQAPRIAGAYELEMALVARRGGCLVAIPGATRRTSVTVYDRPPGATAAIARCGRSTLADVATHC